MSGSLQIVSAAFGLLFVGASVSKLDGWRSWTSAVAAFGILGGRFDRLIRLVLPISEGALVERSPSTRGAEPHAAGDGYVPAIEHGHCGGPPINQRERSSAMRRRRVRRRFG